MQPAQVPTVPPQQRNTPPPRTSVPRDFLDVLRARKSVRSFQAEPLPRDRIEQLIAAATYAPTNCNQQLWNFIVVEDAATKERLVREAASNTLFRRVPAIVFVTYDGWNYKEAIQGAALAVGHLLLAAEYDAVGALPMNSYGADTRIKEILVIPEREVICCAVVLGLPDEHARATSPVPRRPVDEVTHWGKFRSRPPIPFTYDPDDWTLDALQRHQRYYCRKATPGKSMEVVSFWEQDLLQRETAALRDPILDLCTYDGTYLAGLPDRVVHALDLTPETADYSAAAVTRLAARRSAPVHHHVYDATQPLPTAASATLLFKAERLPTPLRRDLFQRTARALPPGGAFVIVARKRNLFLTPFLLLFRLVFGSDVRRSGIFAAFGPYRPVRVRHLLRELETAGFRTVQWSGYFFLPALVPELYQLSLQYRKSEGSSYLHRDRRADILSRVLDRMVQAQGSRRVGMLGSVVVIHAHR